MYYLQCIEKPEILVGWNGWAAKSDMIAEPVHCTLSVRGFDTVEEARTTCDNPEFQASWVWKGKFQFHIRDFTWEVVKQVISYEVV